MNNYVLHFESQEDRNIILADGTWAILGALMHVTHWIPNAILGRTLPVEIPIWVQLWGLPLEYQLPIVARGIGKMIGQIV